MKLNVEFFEAKKFKIKKFIAGEGEYIEETKEASEKTKELVKQYKQKKRNIQNKLKDKFKSDKLVCKSIEGSFYLTKRFVNLKFLILILKKLL
jgi:hypothetical protein